METGKVNIIFVGCDRVARNGDAANKIGTSAVAILAKHYGIPFYVCAPSSTIDMSLASGAEIPIEQRAAEEVTEMWYKKRMAPEGVGVYNSAFDLSRPDHILLVYARQARIPMVEYVVVGPHEVKPHFEIGRAHV